MKIAGIIYEASRGTRTKRQILLSELLDNTIFLLVIPYAAMYASVLLDNTLTFWHLFTYSFDFIPSLFVMAFGLFWIAWSDVIQLKLGGGSTLPLTPAKKLVVAGPYSSTRNPVLFGYIFFLVGLGALFRSFFFTFVFTPLWVILNIFYVKLVEEKELEMKFKDDYAKYKSATPLLFPKIKKNL